MPISIFFPLIYLLLGLSIGRTKLDIKTHASALLTKIVIPFVIAYNIATNQADVFVIIIGMIIIMTMMLLLSRAVTSDPVKNLCFCYLNIGWLGLPIASTLLGYDAATVVIAAYVGSSLFGNSIGVALMTVTTHQQLSLKAANFIKAPSVWALLLGLACVPFNEILIQYVVPVYSLMKFLMGALGMMILGIWLSAASFKIIDFKKELVTFIARALIIFFLSSLFIAICEYYHINLVAKHKAAFYLICLLPPAANIIVLETHYMKTGYSATIITYQTCLSIFFIAIYIALLVGFHL